MRIACVLVIMIGVTWGLPCAGAALQDSHGSDNAQLSIDQMLSIAEKQHEIASLLIKEGQYDRVLPEMQVILDLNLHGEYEELVAKSAGFIAYRLAEKGQFEISHKLLDETISRMQLSANAASLLKIKAYVYKSEGRLADAIKTLEQAVDIERR